MAREINLLSKKHDLSPQLLLISKFVKKIALFSVLFLVIAVVFLLSFSIYIGAIEKGIKGRSEIATKQIESNKATESLYLAYFQKIAGIDSLIKERYYPSDNYRKIKLLVPSNAKLGTYTSNPANISFSISTDSLESMQLFIQGIQNNSGFPIKDISMQGLEKNKEKYNARFSLILSSTATKSGSKK